MKKFMLTAESVENNGRFTVRYSTTESGWVDIASFGTLADAEAEYYNQLGQDQKDGTTDIRTEIIDQNGNIIMAHEGEDYL